MVKFGVVVWSEISEYAKFYSDRKYVKLDVSRYFEARPASTIQHSTQLVMRFKCCPDNHIRISSRFQEIFDFPF